jgi:hypothetical protein
LVCCGCGLVIEVNAPDARLEIRDRKDVPIANGLYALHHGW